MYKAIVFAGTTEGYALCEFLAENRVSVYACAATEYGGSLLQENEFLHVSAGRLKTEDMEELFRKENPEIVLDAALKERRTVKPSMWKAQKKRQRFFPVQREIFFLQQEVRNWRNLQEFRIIKSVYLPESCPFLL